MDPDANARDDLATELDRLLQVLADAAAVVSRAGGHDRTRLVGVLQDGCAAFQRAAAGAKSRSAGEALAPEAMGDWLHDLRARVGTIGGWARFLSQQRDEATWLRTADVIERNVKFLGELLAHPPG